jgi:hypothetical protein
MLHSTEVKSSTISHVGYDSDTKDLTVTFHHGGTYLYKGVTPEEHEALINAPSVGKHFHANIRPKYTGAKQAPRPEEVAVAS